MKESFEHFILQKLKIDPKSKLLLAVSGGMDSMCLWELCRRSGLNFIVAHCNFKLRGEDSDGDEAFVLNYATNDEKIYSKSFNTKEYVAEKSVSIQMAARELRYSWFDELYIQEKCDFIVTAHHLDDQIETFFIQLLRKASLPGLNGMPIKTDKLIRPLMFAGKESIETFIEEHNIPFRKDKSNDSDVYLRNRIRRNLIPVLQKTSPDFKSSVLELMSNINEVSNSFEKYIERRKEELLRINGDEVRIDLEDLINIEFPQIFLENYLRELGFGRTVAKILLHATDMESGKIFYSNQWRIIKDRKDLIILPLKLNEQDIVSISKNDIHNTNEFFIKSEIWNNSGGILDKVQDGNALLDFDKLSDDLIFRKWKNGDFFYPLGLGGKKKLSDYFIDKKFSLIDKENQWLMISGDDICWIVGHSIDDRFKIREKTKVVLFLEQQ